MSKETNQIALKVQNLSIGYVSKKESFIVTKDINFQITKGSFVALLGKNGAGKSTLLRTICGVQNKIDGEVFINVRNSQDINHQDLAKQISIVLTERLPESQLTVFELVALGRQPYTNWIDNLNQNDIDKILWALELTDTLILKDKKFYELSDGQLQRVLIARSLAQDTEIIILDEPTAHLDIHHTIKIFTLLKDLVEKTQKTILISSHEVNLSIQLADSLLLMTSEGFLSGSTKELIKKDAFDTLFPKELISFNSELEQFIFHQKK